jgi:hypothetical protein
VANALEVGLPVERRLTDRRYVAALTQRGVEAVAQSRRGLWLEMSVGVWVFSARPRRWGSQVMLRAQVYFAVREDTSDGASLCILSGTAGAIDTEEAFGPSHPSHRCARDHSWARSMGSGWGLASSLAPREGGVGRWPLSHLPVPRGTGAPMCIGANNPWCRMRWAREGVRVRRDEQ